jgi:hypothetical protein
LLSSPNEHLGTAPAAPALRGREDERRLLRLSEQEPTSPLIPRSLRTTAESHARARPCVRFAMVSVRAAVRVATDRLVGVHRDVCLLDEGGSL